MGTRPSPLHCGGVKGVLPNAGARASSAAAIFERPLSLEFLHDHSAEFAPLPAVLHLGNTPSRCALPSQGLPPSLCTRAVAPVSLVFIRVYYRFNSSLATGAANGFLQRRNLHDMKPAHLILLLVMNFFWGASLSAYKVLEPSVSSGSIVTLRFGLAAISLLLAWPWLPGPAPRGRDLVRTCLMGLMLFVVGQRLQVYGNQLGTAGNSSVLMALEPLVTSVAAALFLGEHIGPRRWVGFGLGMIGVGLLNGVWRSDFQRTGLAASLIFVSSFVCEAAYSIMGKPLIIRISTMKMLAISLVVGTMANLVIDGSATLHAAERLSVLSWFMLAVLGVVCTAIGYTIWFVVIRDCPVNVAALTIFAQSVFGAAVAAVWIGEKLGWGHLLGSLTIAAGLVFGLSHQIHGKDAETSKP